MTVPNPMALSSWEFGLRLIAALIGGALLGRVAWVWLEIARDVRRMPQAAHHAQAGLTALRAGDPREAIRCLRIATGIYPADLSLWAALGYAHLEAGDELHGMQALSAAARGSRTLAAALGLETHPYGPFLQPQELAGLPVRLRPDREMGLWLTILRGEYDLALELIDHHRFGYESSALTELCRATCLLPLGREDEALASLALAVSRDPHDASVLYQAGVVYRAAGRLDHARELHERLVYRHAQFALSHYALGRTLAACDDLDAAKRCYDRAQNLAGLHPELWLLIGEARQALGDRPAAAEAFWEALRVAGPPREYAALIARVSDRLRHLGHRTTDAEPLT